MGFINWILDYYPYFLIGSLLILLVLIIFQDIRKGIIPNILVEGVALLGVFLRVGQRIPYEKRL